MEATSTIGQTNNVIPLNLENNSNSQTETTNQEALNNNSVESTPVEYSTAALEAPTAQETTQQENADTDLSDTFVQDLKNAFAQFMQKILTLFLNLFQSLGTGSGTPQTQANATDPQDALAGGSANATDTSAAAADTQNTAPNDIANADTTALSTTPADEVDASADDGTLPGTDDGTNASADDGTIPDTTDGTNPSTDDGTLDTGPSTDIDNTPSTDEGDLPTDNQTDDTTPTDQTNDTTPTDQTNDTPNDTNTNIPDSSTGEWGDPHFDLVGSNGRPIHFDHKGIDGHTYNLFSGDGFQIDGKYVPYSDPNNPQVVGEVRVTAGNDTVTYNKNGDVRLNGNSVDNGIYQLDNGSLLRVRGQDVRLMSPEKDARIIIRSENAGITVDPEGDFTNADGIIGAAVSQNRELSRYECDQYDVTGMRAI